jgi:hypothetical protein
MWAVGTREISNILRREQKVGLDEIDVAFEGVWRREFGYSEEINLVAKVARVHR